MKNDALIHFLDCIPKSVDKAIDLSPIKEYNTLIAERFNSIIEDIPEDKEVKYECIYCICDESQLRIIQKILEDTHSLLSNTGQAFFCISTLNDISEWDLISRFRVNGLKIVESSIDNGFQLKSHIFHIQKMLPVNNVVIIKESLIPCAPNTLQCEIQNGFGMPSCCQMHLLEMLQFISNLCVEKDIMGWLDGGTLLGAARNGQLIPWDKNANFAIQNKDLGKFKSLYKHFALNGYHLTADRQSLRVNYSRKNELCVRIYTYSVNESYMCYNRYKFKAEHLNPLSTIVLNGVKYNAPNNLDEFLTAQYGANWKIPSNSNGPVTDVIIQKE